MMKEIECICDLPMYRVLTEEEKRSSVMIHNFIDWFAPSKEIASELSTCLIVLMDGARAYRELAKGTVHGKEESNTEN